MSSEICFMTNSVDLWAGTFSGDQYQILIMVIKFLKTIGTSITDIKTWAKQVKSELGHTENHITPVNHKMPYVNHKMPYVNHKMPYVNHIMS